MTATRGSAAEERLLRGALTPEERRQRRRLVRSLSGKGVPAAQIAGAADQDRLWLLPAEVELQGRRRVSDALLQRQTGIERRTMDAYRHASGLPPCEDLTGLDLSAARALAELLDRGIPFDGVLAVARVAGQSLGSVARASIRAAGEVFLRPGDTEYDVAMRFAEIAETLAPQVSRLVDYQFRLHLREALRQETVGRTERLAGRLPASQEVTVAFTDLVGFTRLGDRIEADEIGEVAARLVELAYATCTSGVSIVKTIGDAVMLVGAEAPAVIECVLDLVAAIDAEGHSFPQGRAGVASGPATPLGGDWYGHVVNLASRLTAMARPGTVLSTASVRGATAQQFRWSRSRPRRLRGIRGPVWTARVRGRLAPAPSSRDGDSQGGPQTDAIAAPTFPETAADALGTRVSYDGRVGPRREPPRRPRA